MSLYLDTSCLLKLFFPERESARVAALVAAEERVAISTLAHLELRVQVQGRVAGGTLPARSATALMAVIDRTLGQSPYEIAETPSNVFAIAAGQIAPFGRIRFVHHAQAHPTAAHTLTRPIWPGRSECPCRPWTPGSGSSKSRAF